MQNWQKYKKQIFKNKYFYLPLFGQKQMILKYYKKMKNIDCNLDNPTTFNEFLQKRKLDKNNRLYILCADKYKVREYVEKKIGGQYLIPIYFALKKVKKQDIDNLPNAFVLKTANGSGTNIIVRDKSKENINDIVKKINYFSKIQFGYIWFEEFYNKIKPLIIAEELQLDKKGDIPYDYKFHCFNGKKGGKIFIAVDINRFSNHTRNIYDENWNKLNISYGFPMSDENVQKPKKLKEMLEVAKKLSDDFDYVRIDLYFLENKIYFGEMTFIPEAGYGEFVPSDYNKKWGSYLKN
ncbi:MAG: ATP-grasp fold amidoligase family protein [Bacilli bacterium]|nr:ATP-grasp fold amidoligase family protein [Bacilli bacterium]